VQAANSIAVRINDTTIEAMGWLERKRNMPIPFPDKRRLTP
jgi:hypothetical protein